MPMPSTLMPCSVQVMTSVQYGLSEMRWCASRSESSIEAAADGAIPSRQQPAAELMAALLLRLSGRGQRRQSQCLDRAAAGASFFSCAFNDRQITNQGQTSSQLISDEPLTRVGRPIVRLLQNDSWG